MLKFRTVDYPKDDGTVLNTYVSQPGSFDRHYQEFPALWCLRHFNIHVQFLAPWGSFSGRDERGLVPDRIFSRPQRLARNCDPRTLLSLSR